MYSFLDLKNTVAIAVDALDDGSYSWTVFEKGITTTGSTRDIKELEERWSNALEKFVRNLEADSGALSEEKIAELKDK